MNAAMTMRYDIQAKVGSGGMGAVYRAKDRLTGEVVALKKVALPRTSPNDEMTLALAQEFRLLASLRHPFIISVLDYGFDAQQQPFFTMELLENARPITKYASDVALEKQVELILQMLEALRYLHRRGIIHRDVKPDNVLVVDGRVRVLDFGLAQEGEARQAVGTLYYLAPEVLQGGHATETADLYAAGVVAYELLAGQHPFPAKNPGAYIKMMLTEEPYLDGVPAIPALRKILRKLLARSPDDRYQNADELLRDFAAAGYPLPPENAALRESYLQAARFVGRDHELGQLMEALSALSIPPPDPPRFAGRGDEEGVGSAWLIGGESGVGKTRLVEELRIRAMVAGAAVLRGQAVSGSQLPYHVWREPLRWLALAVELSDAEAGIIKSLVPDIETLLQRPVKDAPRLDGAGGQQRLAQTVVELFRRPAQPVVLILEDAHWLQGMDIVRLLAENIVSLRVLMIVTYRDDESPGLPDELPEMGRMKLERLSEAAMADLSASMLGSRGTLPGVLELIKRETEGNVFFIVEVVRALAEEAGTLAEVGSKTLPPKVFAGGIRTVVQRRLDAVPPEAKGVLIVAALLGREPDIRVLRALYADADAVLMQASSAAVMTVEDGHWRFAHDKLRDALLEGIPESAILHRHIAETMEQLYPYQPDKAPLLAHHWHEAGENNREAGYALLAGEQAFYASSYRPALTYLERALELETHLTAEQRVLLWLLTGEVTYALGDYPRARQVLQACVAQSPAGPIKARALNLLGNIALAFGEYAAARSLLQTAFIASDDRREIGRATRSLGVISESQNDPAQARLYYEAALKTLQENQDSAGMAATLSNLASLAAAEQRYEEARQLYIESIALFKDIRFLWGVAYATTSLGLTVQATGDYPTARQHHQEALTLCRRIGHQWGIAFCSNNLAESCLMLNDPGAAAVALHEALQITTRLNITPTILDTLTGFAALLGLTGDVAKAIEVLAFVLHHPAVEPGTTRKSAGQWLNKFKPLLAWEQSHAATERGEKATLEQLTDYFLKWQFASGW